MIAAGWKVLLQPSVSSRRTVETAPTICQATGSCTRICFAWIYYLERGPISLEQHNLTMSEAFEEFINSRMANGVKDITIKSYRGHFHSISNHLDTRMPISSIEKKDIEKMIVSMRKAQLRSATIQTYTRCLKTFINWARSENLTDLQVKLYRAEKSMKEPYTDNELALLLQAPNDNCEFWELRDWVIINFLINSGCRCATLRNILIKDVDFNSNTVFFRHTKNGCPQTMPLCNKMVKILKTFLPVRDGLLDDVLFCNDHFSPFTQTALRTTIIRYNRSRGVYKTSIHLFRHTFAKKFLLDCEGDPFTLQQLLGHKSLEMTRRYCNLYNSDIANRFESICPLSKLYEQQENKH